MVVGAWGAARDGWWGSGRGWSECLYVRAQLREMAERMRVSIDDCAEKADIVRRIAAAHRAA